MRKTGFCWAFLTLWLPEFAGSYSAELICAAIIVGFPFMSVGSCLWCSAVAATISVIGFLRIVQNLLIGIMFAIIFSVALAPTIGASALHWWFGYNLLWVVPVAVLTLIFNFVLVASIFGNQQDLKKVTAPSSSAS
jgi:hypothetical protein